MRTFRSLQPVQLSRYPGTPIWQHRRQYRHSRVRASGSHWKKAPSRSVGGIGFARRYGFQIGCIRFPHRAFASIDLSLKGMPWQDPAAGPGEAPLLVKACLHLDSSHIPSLRGSRTDSFSNIASAAGFARSPVSPAGPTHEGHPFSQGQPAISSRVRLTSDSCM